MGVLTWVRCVHGRARARQECGGVLRGFSSALWTGRSGWGSVPHDPLIGEVKGRRRVPEGWGSVYPMTPCFWVVSG